ncbi:hypothetical protein BH11MYX4_BH11MYX4_45150 [soil metagenome]
MRASSLLSRTMLALACLAALNGCGYTYHFKDTTALRGEEHNEWASYFIFGLVGDYEVNVKEFCPNGVYEIATGNNFATWFLRVITIGIYSPRKVNIWCSAGPSSTAFEVEFGKDGAPSQVTKRVGSATWTGEVKPAGEGRFGVQLAAGGAQ